jgi:hypothetical protein
MGAPVAGAMLRRALAIVIGSTTAFTVLAGAAVPAHALLPCSSFCPVANDDARSTSFNTKLTVAAPGVLANDAGDATTRVIDYDTQSFEGATVVVHDDGSFTYTPDNTISGVDEFGYTIEDGSGTSDATVTVTVKPILKADAYSVSENHKLVVAAPGVLGNDLGFDAFTIQIDTSSAHHAAIFDNGDGAFEYMPAHNFVGTDTFHYKVDDLDNINTYTGTVTVTVKGVAPPPPPKPTGYWMVGATGIVYAFGQVHKYGNAPTNAATHIEGTPSRRGYWVLDAYGRVFAFGDAHVFGRVPNLRPGEFARSLSSTPTGNGYWIFTDRGRVFARGAARSFGDMSRVTLQGPVIGSSATPTGRGYYMVATDGGIFSFGDARFYGSMGGTHLNQPVNGLVPTSNNRGYWLVASDGGIFAFGNARFRGSMGSTHLNRPIIGMVRYGIGYLMVSSDGGIFAFSNLPFAGSLGNNPPPVPIVGVASGG